MIQIEEEKIAELMFDIWYNSKDLKNPVMVGEYIANKLKEVITVTHCCKSDSEQLKDKEEEAFELWLKDNCEPDGSGDFYYNKIRYFKHTLRRIWNREHKNL